VSSYSPHCQSRVSKSCVFIFLTEEASEREWSIDEVTRKFQRSAEKKYWRVALREGVDFVDDIFKGNFKKASQENTEYVARYDFTYLSPGGYELRCKVS